MPERGEILEIGKSRVLFEGSDVAILSFGAHMGECIKAAGLMEENGVTVTMVDARFAKPLDMALIRRLVSHHKAVVTVEQGSRGGFGAMVLHELANQGLLDGRCQLRTVTLPDRYVDQAAPDAMYADAGMTAVDIAATAMEAAGTVLAGVKSGADQA